LKGGVALSQGNQSFLRFSLEESVWFQRGQEVEELVSISLDPNITIQETDQYVTIRGTLDLTGEYKCQGEVEDENSQEPSVQKWVHSVDEREEGLYEFSHRFPVDITIPTYRVRDLSEIDVIIETFDYLLPERSCLKLTADLNVTGLYEEQASVVKQEEEEEEEDVFELSYRSQEEEEEVEPSLLDTEDNDADDEDYEPFEVEARKEDTFFAEPTLAESSSHQPSIPEISFAAYRSEQPAVQAEESEEEVQPIAEDENLSVEDETPAKSPKTMTSVVDYVKNKLTNKKSMSISEFLSRKEGEEHAKLKVCIVQNGESIGTLADRYDISVQQLLKVNHLEPNQDVYEGQVLYVPSVSAKK
jgi:stage VI sporulation protein D